MSAETTSPAPKEALRVDPLFALSLGEAAVLIEMIDDPTSPVRGVDGREDAGYNIHVLSIPRTAEELADWPEDEKVIPHIVLAVIDTREHQDFATEIPRPQLSMRLNILCVINRGNFKRQHEAKQVLSAV